MKKNKRLIPVAIPLILVLVVLMGYEYGYLRIRDDLKAIQDIELTKQKTLQKYVSLIAEKPDLEKKLATLKERRKIDNSKIIEGQTPSLSAATLQETLKGIITTRGGSISSERVEKPEDLGAFKVINVSIDTVLPDMRALGEILYGIETRTPYLVARELDTRVRNFREPRELMVKFKISALIAGK